MHRYRFIVVTLPCAAMLCGCGNTAYGPIRPLSLSAIKDDPAFTLPRACSPEGAVETRNSLNLAGDFYEKACASLRKPDDPGLAKMMMDAGVTLNRMRCTDFFAERGGRQTGERVIRGAIVPLSALITGILGLVSFKTDAGRKEAVQILGLGQTATIAGLELYESEFLFGAANVNSVRQLTLRALDEHATKILAVDVNFYGAARHLIDDQMICTPANILELAQSAIREGNIESSTPINPAVRSAMTDNDTKTIATLGSNLQVGSLSADQLGALWWLTKLTPAQKTDQNVLAVIKNRLGKLPISPITESAGALSVNDDVAKLLPAQLNGLSPGMTNGFVFVSTLMLAAIAQPTPADVLERTKDLHFKFPSGYAAPGSGAVEVRVQSNSDAK